MANNGNQDIHDAATRIGILSQRTTNLETLVGDMRRAFDQSISSVNASIGAMSSKVEERFNSISAGIAERNKTQWPVIWSAIGVSFAVLAYFVTQSQAPIKDTQADLKQTIAALATETNRSIQALADRVITREEIDWRSERGAEDRKRTDEAISELRSTMVARNEWMERNASRDHEIASIHESETRGDANLQRQIDLIRADFSAFAQSLGNGRDTFQNLQDQIKRLEDYILRENARRSRTPPTQ